MILSIRSTRGISTSILIIIIINYYNLSRGKNHYVIRTTVVDKKLYVFTAQCKEDNFDELKGTTYTTNAANITNTDPANYR